MVTKNYNRIIGARLRALRKDRHISQKVIGDILGVSFQQVQKYERGIDRISAGAIQRISEKIGVPVGYFFVDFSHKETAL